jgi:hypothetical protein
VGADDGNLGWGVRKRRKRGGWKITSETWGWIETTETRGGRLCENNSLRQNGIASDREIRKCSKSIHMSDSSPWGEYTEIAEETLQKCNMSDPHEQTVQYVAVMLWTESELADLEKELSEISSVNPFQWSRLQRAMGKYAEISSTVHRFQKTTTDPESHLHDLIDVNNIESAAVSDITTQLGWEFFPRHLNRFLNLYERVGRELDSKKQQLLTTGILLVSFVALLVTMMTQIASILI